MALALSASAFAATPGGSGGNKAITTDIVDNGGSRVSITSPSGTVVVDHSTGGILGVSGGGAFSVKHGFIAQLYEDAPNLGSTLTAMPNPATTAQVVTFTVQGTDEDPFTITWDFGDGSGDSTNQASVTHTYGTPGVYNAKVQLIDADLLVTEATIVVTVIAAGNPPGDIDGDGIPNELDSDSDGDGFPNVVEAEAGTDPLNAGNTPFGTQPAGTALPLSVTKMSIGLNFKLGGKDGISVAGLLPISAGFSPSGKIAILDVGGVARVFRLDGKGRSQTAFTRLQIGIKATKGVVAAQQSKFAIKFMKGNFAAALADEKLTGATNVVGEQRTVLVSLYFDNKLYQSQRVLGYTAKAGSTGKAK
jgi:hypothetical protein